MLMDLYIPTRSGIVLNASQLNNNLFELVQASGTSD